jgi:iron complex transport system permease protein
MKPQRGGWVVILALTSLTLMLLGASLGSQGLQWPWQLRADPVAAQILWDIRWPRTLGAWLAGALLGLSGALAQGLFRNPLADPYLLGSASGASLGVSVFLGLLGAAGMPSGAWAQMGMTGAAFVGAVAAVLMTLALARGVQQTMRLLLAGVVVGVVLGAITSLTVMLQPRLLIAMQGFLLGSSALLGWSACVVMGLVLLVVLVLGRLLARVLDALTLGEATAHSLGLALGHARLALIALMALATGAAVAQTGLIAFVGLAAPHAVRSRLQTPHAGLLLLSALMGGVMLLAADILARAVWPGQELPVGVFTAVLGGGYLMWRMRQLQVGQA